MKLVLLNVKYSPNLGDGIIAECLEETLRDGDGSLEVSSCDLAGRTDYGHGVNRSRRLVFAVLDRLPKPIRRRCMSILLNQLVRSKLRSHYRKCLHGADMAIIGGGQLIDDADLNFPIKINAAASAAREERVKLGIYAAGVGSGFSREGKSLLTDAFAEGLDLVMVRDALSKRRWGTHFAGCSAGVVNDPGLLSSEVYAAPKRPIAVRPKIGIGVMNPSTLNLHSDRAGQSFSGWRAFFADLACQVASDGFDVELFTNGAHDDGVFAADVFRQLPERLRDSGRVTLCPAMSQPSQLALKIASYDGMIAHRLHANVIAYSYGVPHIGLGWNSKMEGFFDLVGRSEFLVGSARPEVEEVRARLGLAMEKKIDDQKRLGLISATRQQIKALLCTMVRNPSRMAATTEYSFPAIHAPATPDNASRDGAWTC